LFDKYGFIKLNQRDKFPFYCLDIPIVSSDEANCPGCSQKNLHGEVKLLEFGIYDILKTGLTSNGRSWHLKCFHEYSVTVLKGKNLKIKIDLNS
jgi:hypothetical protein